MVKNIENTALFQKIYAIKYKNKRNNKTNEKRT